MSDIEDFPSATPILDSGVLPPGKRFKKILNSLLGFVVGVILGIVVIKIVHELPGGALSPLIFFAIFFLAVAIHECGHLTAGWLLGFHFNFFSVGPFSIRIEYGKLKVHLRTGMLVAGYAGMHIDVVRRLRRRMLLYIAGGPFVNLFSSLVAILLVKYAFSSSSDARAILEQFAIISFFLGVFSLIPFGLGHTSDGSRIAALLVSRVRARRLISIIASGSQQRKGIRPKFWKQSWLKSASAIQDSSLDELSANLAAYLSANDKKDVPAASRYLERCLKLAPFFRPRQDFVVHEAAFFTAWFRSNASLAEKWLAQVKKRKHMTRLMQIRMDIALSCARQNFDAALSSWQDGATFIQQLPETPVRERLRESWFEWHGEIVERQNQLVAAGS